MYIQFRPSVRSLQGPAVLGEFPHPDGPHGCADSRTLLPHELKTNGLQVGH
jgi:hypothetical protein